MAYEDFNTYDETDEGGNVTVTASKISWALLTRAQSSHVSLSKGSAHFGGDLEHKFRCQHSNVFASPLACFWALANTQADYKALIDAGADAAMFYHYTAANLRLVALENGAPVTDQWAGASSSVTYYVTVRRDDDGGANGTGQYTAEVRTGGHAGTLKDTLTVDCSAGEQNDFEYVFGLMSYDDNDAGNRSSGFTENLDLQEAPTIRGRPGFRLIEGADRLRGLRRFAPY
jgi:hypothetical protein